MIVLFYSIYFGTFTQYRYSRSRGYYALNEECSDCAIWTPSRQSGQVYNV